MAENKKAIIVYADWIDKFEELEDDEAGRLIKHFFRYVNDLNPVAPDRITKICFVDIENQLKRDLKKWEGIVEDRSINGRLGNIKRWHKDLYADIVLEKITLEEAEYIAKTRKLSLPDKNTSPPIANIAVNVNDTVNVNENVNDILLKQQKNINNILLSEIKISDDSDFIIFKNEEFEISEKEKQYLKTAIAFQKLFIKNLKEKNSPTKNQEQAKFKNYVTPIRLMIESDGVDSDQIREAYKYLNSIEGEFWKKNILSTESLRKNIQKLIINKNTQSNGIQSQHQSTGNKRKPFVFSIDGAKKAIAAKAQRRLPKMESDDFGTEEYID